LLYFLAANNFKCSYKLNWTITCGTPNRLATRPLYNAKNPS
jgi:hypothetical protein